MIFSDILTFHYWWWYWYIDMLIFSLYFDIDYCWLIMISFLLYFYWFRLFFIIVDYFDICFFIFDYDSHIDADDIDYYFSPIFRHSLLLLMLIIDIDIMPFWLALYYMTLLILIIDDNIYDYLYRLHYAILYYWYYCHYWLHYWLLLILYFIIT